MNKVFIVTTDDQVHQIVGNWWGVDTSPSAFDGGGFWEEVAEHFPDVSVKEIRIVPDTPIKMND